MFGSGLLLIWIALLDLFVFYDTFFFHVNAANKKEEILPCLASTEASYPHFYPLAH